MTQQLDAQDSSSPAKQPHLKLDLPPRGALASVGFNNALAAGIEGTSSEDDSPAITDDVRTAVGVSIGREQTRLTSPKTPAVDKVRAIEQAGGFFGPADITEEASEEQFDVDEEKAITSNVDGTAADDDVTPTREIPARSARRTSPRRPSPWRADVEDPFQAERRKTGLFEGLWPLRRRASSGPETFFGSWQKSFMSSLPSMPKQLSQNAPSSSSTSTSIKLDKGDSRQEISPYNTVETEHTRVQEVADDAPQRPSMAHLQSKTSQLRRSMSDHSLMTQRSLSRVESLGDDTRFEHVQEQVNSRIKALKDSLADSNIRLLGRPTLSSFYPDVLRERGGSVGKQGDSSESQHRPVDPMTRQPYSSAKAAISDATSGKSVHHPHFSHALSQLEGDVVVLGGYRGSVLRSAEPPYRQWWVPVKVGLNLRKVDLEVGIEEGDDERATDKIIPDGMLTHIGPVDISRRLFKRLRTSPNARAWKLRVHDYGYDWRLDPTYLSKQMIEFLENLPCNKPGVPHEQRGATVIAHSLGGLITRHAINQRPELFNGVVYAGVPTTCVNILGPLRNGDEVMLSSRVLTAQVNFTIRTSFALLPLDGRCFFNKQTREEYPVDFFDPQTWIDYRLSPCVGRPFPPLNNPPRPGALTGYVNSVANALPSFSLTGRRSSVKPAAKTLDVSKAVTAAGAAEPDTLSPPTANGPVDTDEIASASTSPGTTVTLPRDKAVEYLTRTLTSIKKFKQDLAFRPEHAASNLYPPVSVIYGKSTPTVYGAKVDSREGIKHSDAYDELAFASGDGVVLARAAMVPEGYVTARGGVVASDRGHVTLLGDLEAVGQCLHAVARARRKGVGLGK